MKFIYQLRRFFQLAPATPSSNPDVIDVHSHLMPIIYRRHARARNYVLRLYANKTVVVTVPRAGSKNFARSFVASRKTWLEKQWRLLETRKIPPNVLQPGMQVLFRGAPTVLNLEKSGLEQRLQFADAMLPMAARLDNLRPMLEQHLRTLAHAELPRRTHELAAQHHVSFKRVMVRNQKSRWGSCSHNGTISLNWRLVQLPDAVRDYIIIHELMHLKQLNHSDRFWHEVEKACPAYRDAENWLKQNSGQVGF